MKRLFTILLFFTLSIPVLSQELNFNDLIYLYKNSSDIDKCDSYLAQKKFTYLEYSDGKYIYTYNRRQNKTADAFCILRITSVSLQSTKRQTFDYYKQIASSYKMKLIENGVDDLGGLSWTYNSDKYYLSLTQSLDEGGSGSTVYLIYFAMY